MATKCLFRTDTSGGRESITERSALQVSRKNMGDISLRSTALETAHTSTARDAGYGKDEYFYVSARGNRTRLKLQGVEDQPDDMVHNFTYYSPPQEVTMFFVGPQIAIKTKLRPELLP